MMGHVQLKVTDPGLIATEAFYGDALGLKLLARVAHGPVAMLAFGVDEDQAPFVLTNRFSLEGSQPAPEASAHLIAANFMLPTPDDLQALAGNLDTLNSPYKQQSGVLSVRDPSGNLLRFSARPS